MTDLEIAIKHLPGHTLALCRNKAVITSDKRGIAPMLDFINEGRELTGYCAADRVVGKAAAMLFIKAGIKSVFAQTLSKSAQMLLLAHDVTVCCGELTDNIMNRDNTGMCPMEASVADTDDVEEGIKKIKAKLEKIKMKI